MKYRARLVGVRRGSAVGRSGRGCSIAWSTSIRGRSAISRRAAVGGARRRGSIRAASGRGIRRERGAVLSRWSVASVFGGGRGTVGRSVRHCERWDIS